MPYTDDEWGEWNEYQYNVPPRPAWLESYLLTDEIELQRSIITLPLETSSTTLARQNYLPSLFDFRCWYVWARETGRSERYLKQIEVLAVNFKQKTLGAEVDIHLINPRISLSDARRHSMEEDRQNYRELLDDFLRDAKTLIDKQGVHEIFCGQKVLSYKSERGEYNLSYYINLNRVVVRKNSLLLAYYQDKRIYGGAKFVTRRDVSLFKQWLLITSVGK